MPCLATETQVGTLEAQVHGGQDTSILLVNSADPPVPIVEEEPERGSGS